MFKNSTLLAFCAVFILSACGDSQQEKSYTPQLQAQEGSAAHKVVNPPVEAKVSQQVAKVEDKAPEVSKQVKRAAPAPNLVAQITGVNPDQEADKAGIKVGDQIVSVNGQPFSSREHFIQTLKSQDQPTLDIYSGGMRHQLALSANSLGVRAEFMEPRALAPLPTQADSHGWYQNYSAASKRAQDEGKLVLLFYTGSDWCPPCKQLHRNLFENHDYMTQLSEKYVLCMLDFPKKKQQQPSITLQNRSLNRRDQVSGFPTMIVEDPTSGDHLWKKVGGMGGEAALTKLIAVASEAEVKS